MNSSYPFFLFLVLTIFPVSTRVAVAQPMSYADVFPLAVGNQWTYRYDMGSADLFQDIFTTEVGAARYTILNKTTEQDSTMWVFQEFLDVSHCVHFFFPPGRDTCYRVLDSTQFEIVEMHEGRHRLWRVGMFYDVWWSVFPFSQDLSDTTVIYRYQPVDSTLSHSLETHPPGEYPPMTFFLSFKRDSGLVSVRAETRFLVGSIDHTAHQLLSSVITEVGDGGARERPEEFLLAQNYPNPFNPGTKIAYRVNSRESVSLVVYDVLGREVATLVNERKEPGSYEVTWDAGDRPSGVYFYRMSAPHFVQTRKLLLIR